MRLMEGLGRAHILAAKQPAAATAAAAVDGGVSLDPSECGSGMSFADGRRARTVVPPFSQTDKRERKGFSDEMVGVLERSNVSPPLPLPSASVALPLIACHDSWFEDDCRICSSPNHSHERVRYARRWRIIFEERDFHPPTPITIFLLGEGGYGSAAETASGLEEELSLRIAHGAAACVAPFTTAITFPEDGGGSCRSWISPWLPSQLTALHYDVTRKRAAGPPGVLFCLLPRRSAGSLADLEQHRGLLSSSQRLGGYSTPLPRTGRALPRREPRRPLAHRCRANFR
ncbi:hypothetical protein HPB51_025124 [Rhipicephalus microplus]|uniref:Uncharacterized protein n=1 Tax=Rhipicephalus microplus TaxID=6941 RepID=A0A9J6DR98_RHIMP|nr:hypothetical protein HPB51_025124 [Rhipicephalus microplus]